MKQIKKLTISNVDLDRTIFFAWQSIATKKFKRGRLQELKILLLRSGKKNIKIKMQLFLFLFDEV